MASRPSASSISSSLGKGKVILKLTNYEQFRTECRFLYGPLGKHIYSCLNDPNYELPPAPTYTDTLVLPGVPAGYYLYSEVINGVVTMKLDAATISLYQKAVTDHDTKLLNYAYLESAVLQDMYSRVSPVSMQQMSTFAGVEFNTVYRISLIKSWKLIKESHDSPASDKLLECTADIVHLNMGPEQDFFDYLEQASLARQAFESNFASYLEKPLKVFLDLLLTVSVVGGLNKSTLEFDPAIQAVRLLDLNKPAPSDIFPGIQKQLLNAHQTRSLLLQKQPITMSNSSITANSSMTSTVVSKCAKCQVTIPLVVDEHGVKVRNYCTKCHNENYQKRKQSEKAAAAAGKTHVEKGKIPLKQSSAAGGKGKKVDKVEVTKVAAPKIAAAQSFAGTTANLAVSAVSTSHHYLLDEGDHAESEYDEEGDDTN